MKGVSATMLDNIVLLGICGFLASRVVISFSKLSQGGVGVSMFVVDDPLIVYPSVTACIARENRTVVDGAEPSTLPPGPPAIEHSLIHISIGGDR